MASVFCPCGTYVEYAPNGWLKQHKCLPNPTPELTYAEQMIVEGAWSIVDNGNGVNPHALLITIERLIGKRDSKYKLVGELCEQH